MTPEVSLIASPQPPAIVHRRRFASALLRAGCCAFVLLSCIGVSSAEPCPTEPCPTEPCPAPSPLADPPKKGIAPNPAVSVALQVQSFYLQTSSYQASFKQTYRAKVQNKTRVSSGRVAFVKSGKFSFRYANGNRVVSNGKTVKVYEQENKQLYRSRVKASAYPAAIAFLFGNGELTRDFKLRLVKGKRRRVKDGWLLEAIPKAATPAYRKLLLYVDKTTKQVRRVLLLDAQGNQNRFDFTAPVYNKKVPAKEFRFKAPRGTKVVDL